MPTYLRPRVPGATVFFTVNLADRASELLTQEIDTLRSAVRRTLAERPFQIDAWVVLPDHMHCVWTLPAGDADYENRWRIIKARFARSMPTHPDAQATHDAENTASGSAATGNTTFATRPIGKNTSPIAGTIR